MHKLLGILLIVLSGSTLGSQCAAILKRRVRALEAIIKMLDSLELKINTFSTPLDEFFDCYKDELLESCGFLQEVRENGFSCALKSNADEMYLTEDDVRLLSEFADDSLHFSAAEQARRCHYYKCECQKLADQAKESLPLYTRLLGSLGIMSGILASVLII
ncbi:MAG: hypothetical protein E7635_02705 [Ruminococcaceae bacterium]|nr:hypothetical protein [Oscillospiraceae bacterium]